MMNGNQGNSHEFRGQLWRTGLLLIICVILLIVAFEPIGEFFNPHGKEIVIFAFIMLVAIYAIFF